MTEEISIQSLEISKYDFNNESINSIKADFFVKNFWPLIYILSNSDLGEAYVGESAHTFTRMKDHLRDKNRKKLNTLYLITSRHFTKSIAFDLEARLINYMAGEGKFKLQNINAGLVLHNYFQKENYSDFFPHIWSQLKDKFHLKTLEQIDISDLFIYSPYKSLNADQYNSVREIIYTLTNSSRPIFVQGGAGTGKTVLAVFLLKLLATDKDDLFDTSATESDEMQALRKMKEKFPNPKIALVVPMRPLRATLKKVFRKVKGLSAKMVIGPSEAAASKTRYDILIVDEAHRLRQRRNLPNFNIFDNTSKKLNMGKTKTELDWLKHKSTHQVLFYDQDQSVMPADIAEKDFARELQNSVKLILQSQMRVKGGDDYITYVKRLLKTTLGKTPVYKHKDYELVLFDSLQALLDKIREKDAKAGISRMVAGFAWPRTKNNKNAKDIVIGDISLPWNSESQEWINSPNAIHEVGTIHTVQGYDLSYAGVIFGNDISYDPKINKITINVKNYHDFLAKRGVLEAEIRKNIINAYTTLLTRGAKGTYVYVCDENLREYFRKHMAVFKAGETPGIVLLKHKFHLKDHKQSPNDVPFYDISAAAGDFSDPQQSHSKQWIELPAGTEVKKDYFVCRVVGESMNKKIANGAWCLFKKATGNLKEDDIVLVEDLDINDPEFGAGYTVKKYHSQKTLTIRGREYKTITLKPMSTLKYPDIVLKKDKNRKLDVLGVFVKALEFDV